MSSLRFYLGPSGSGKSYLLFRDIIAQSMEHPEQHFFIVVPEQFSLSTQKELMRLHPQHGTLNIDVTSFHRLAYRVFAETGFDPGQILDENGKSILLYKIITDHKEELPQLGSLLSRPQAIPEIKSILSELTQYQISPSDLLADGDAYPQRLRAKLRDIETIHRYYKEALADTYLNTEEVPLLFAKHIPSSHLLRDAVIGFDGFTGFTPVQLPVLTSLLTCAKEILVTSTVEGDVDLGSFYDSSDRFAMGRTMIRDVLAIAEETKAHILPPVRIVPHKDSRHHSPSLIHLERNLFAAHPKTFTDCPADITIDVCTNPTEEMLSIARSIRRLVREEGLRYRDIAILTGDLTTYGDLARRIFPESGIPVFVDERKTMSQNPGIAFYRAALALSEENWSYDAVFHLLRTGFFPLSDDEIDRLENYVRATGVRGRAKWNKTWTATYRTDDPAHLLLYNDLRERVTALLVPFTEAFGARASVTEKTRALYTLGVQCNVQERLSRMADERTENGDLFAAGAYTRTYPAIMDLLDKFVRTLGDVRLPIAEYRALLDDALSNIRIGIAPPTNDIVMIGDMQRTRLSETKVLFFAGANEGILPAPAYAPTLLTEADRSYLQEQGHTLSPSPREELYRQSFYLYLALTRPQDALHVSYARTTSSGEARPPAFLIETIRHLFPALHVNEHIFVDPGALETSYGAMQALPSLIRQTGDVASEGAAAVYSALQKSDRADAAARFLQALRFRGASEHLRADVAGTLYDVPLRGSATRFERFASCAFLHFARFGLRLSEREEFLYRSLDRGNILHRALEHFSDTLRKEGLSWGSLDDTERDNMMDRCVEEVTATYENLLLQETARSRYEIERLKRLGRRAVWTIAQELAPSDFSPSGFEVAFRGAGDMTDETIDLVGRIDRIDVADRGNEVLVKIADYKTGTTAFDLNELYHGTQLQLVVYLHKALSMIAERTGQVARPAGILYERIDDPIVTADDLQKADGDLRRALLQKLRPNGLLSAEEDILGALDHALSDPQGHSDIYGLRRNKDGSFRKGSPVLSEDNFMLITRFANAKIKEAAASILAGEIFAAPSLYKQQKACDYCPYNGVCGFDAKLPACTVREWHAETTEELLSRMDTFLHSPSGEEAMTGEQEDCRTQEDAYASDQ